jgi:putative transposase
MAWTAEDRRKYAPAIQEVLRRGMLVRLAATIDTIDPPAKTGRPRDWSAVTMLGALRHLARDGCVWRRLPIGPGLPPHQSVWSRFLRWRLRAVLDRALAVTGPSPSPGPRRHRALAVLVACRRLAAGRKRRPTAAIIDTQSVKTGPQRGPRGYDARKKVKGRKRVLMADVEGGPLGVRVVPAGVQDRDALAALAPDLAAHPSLRLAWTDLGFAAKRCGEFLARHGVVQELAGTAGRRGFVVEPRRWKVEQTFGCLQRYRRLRVDDEMSNETSRHMTVLASLFMTGMRLERMLQA